MTISERAPSFAIPPPPQGLAPIHVELVVILTTANHELAREPPRWLRARDRFWGASMSG
jgi:hypothetical protein